MSKSSQNTPGDRGISATPSTVILLRAAQAAVTERLSTLIPDADTNATLRQLKAVLRELIHRETDLKPLLIQQLREGRKLLPQLQALAGLSAAGKRVPADLQRLSLEALQADHQQLSKALQLAVIRAFKRKKMTGAQRTRLERLVARLVVWDNALLAAMAAPAAPPVVQGKSRKRAAVTATTAPEPAALQCYLRSSKAVADDIELQSLRRLSGGFSRGTWLLQVRSTDRGAHGLVIRQQMPAGFLDGLCAPLVQEYPLLQVLHAAGMPVPKTLLLSRSGNPLRSAFILMEQAPGNTAGLPTGECYVVGEKQAFIRGVAQALARLHSIDWSTHRGALKGSQVWAADANMTRHDAVIQLLDHWCQFTAKHIEVVTPGVWAALEWLRANIPQRDGPPSILHGDVGFHNMLFDDGQLTALLDWETAHLGDPAKDVVHIRPAITQYVSWEQFLAWYVEAGGEPVDAATQRYYEILKAVTHVIVCYLARGTRFTHFPGERFELSETGLVHMPYFMNGLAQMFEH